MKQCNHLVSGLDIWPQRLMVRCPMVIDFLCTLVAAIYFDQSALELRPELYVQFCHVLCQPGRANSLRALGWRFPPAWTDA